MFRKLAIATVAALVITGLVAAPSVASPPPPSRRRPARGLHRQRSMPRASPPSSSSASTATSSSRRRAPTARRGRRAGDPERRPGRRSSPHGGTELRAQGRPVGAAPHAWRPSRRACSARTAAPAASRRSSWRRRPRIPKIAELRVIGQTVQGQDIVAVRVTKNVDEGEGRQAPDDRLRRRPARPRVDHARDGPPAARPRPRRLRHATRASPSSSTTTELWFVPVANPDGYDFTFQRGPAAVAQEPARQRRRRRDHARRRRRPQPQLPDPLGLRQRGLVAEPGERDLPRARARPPSPRRRRSTRCSRGITPEFLDQLPLGRRAAAARHRLAGGDAVAGRRDLRGDGRRRRQPGGPRLRPRHLGRAVHDQRRHRRAHAGGVRHARLHAGDVDLRDGVGVDPDDDVGRRGLRERLQLPRRRGADPGRVREEHPVRAGRRRVGARTRTTRCRSSAATPRTSASTRFTVSYGDPQTVAVVAPSATLQDKRMNYRINGGRAQDRAGRGVDGRRALRRRERRLLRRVPRHGARAPSRATASRCGSPARPSATRHRRAARPSRSRASTSPTRWRRTPATRCSIIANEDYTGVNPDVPAPARPRRSTSTSTSPRSQANGVTPDVWDVDAQGVPHDLGVLEPLRRRPLVPRRQPADPGSRGRAHRVRLRSADSRTSSVAERQQYLTMAVRDYLNEGGKLALRR